MTCLTCLLRTNGRCIFEEGDGIRVSESSDEAGDGWMVVYIVAVVSYMNSTHDLSIIGCDGARGHELQKGSCQTDMEDTLQFMNL